MNKKWMKIVSIIIVFSISIGLIGSNISAEEQSVIESAVFADLAFPTAEGYGRFVNGFRGGQVVKVTNLNESGEGSLRWALEEVSGPRIVVFEVAGVIDLRKYYPIEIRDGNVYIAGQTAPGDGITIIGGGITIYNTKQVIIRNLKIRYGSHVDLFSYTNSCIWINKSKEVIVDNCSLSWAPCSSISTDYASNITIQRNILGESITNLNTNNLEITTRSGTGVELDVENCSIYNNLLTNSSGKVWGFSPEIGIVRENNNNIDIRNNVVYNWLEDISGNISKNTQFVNNFYKKGETTSNDILLDLNGKGYVSGNKLVDNNGEVIVDSDNENPWVLVSEESFPDGRSNEPLFDSGVNTLNADEAYEYVIANAGANPLNRDYIDSRIINDVVNGTHTYTSYGTPGIIFNQQHAEGYPDNTTLNIGEAPLDTDNDGMPDEWELLHGLNPNDYYDACQVYLSDEGYTNIELYINELAGDPVKYSDNPTLQYTPATPTPEPTETPLITETPEVTETPELTATPEISESVIPTDIPYVTGDVNADGVVSAEDALAVLKHAAKLESLTTEAQLRADVELDNLIDATDALAILKIAAKIK